MSKILSALALLSLGVLLCGPARATPTAPPEGALSTAIVARSSGAPVVILGEHHRRPGSHRLFLELVEDFVARGERIDVGLEIPADRQADLDAALQGAESCGGIAHPIIDCTSYHQLIRGLGKLVASGAPVTVTALDAPLGSRQDRDAAMAGRVEAALSSGAFDRVLILAGNLHALKRIPWATGLRPPGETLAERLDERGIGVVSVLQQFQDSCAVSAGATFSPPGAPATDSAVRHLWGSLNTRPTGPAWLAAAADGAVSWHCGD